LNKHTPAQLPPPDKNIPAAVMLIGIFEVGIALLGFIVVFLAGHLDLYTTFFVILLSVYGAMGAGLVAIQEWARVSNIVLHLMAIPYALYAVAFLGTPAGWPLVSQVAISGFIVYALTRPAIRYKFQTVVPKKRH
jgi:hypothetical protein